MWELIWSISSPVCSFHKLKESSRTSTTSNLRSSVSIHQRYRKHNTKNEILIFLFSVFVVVFFSRVQFLCWLSDVNWCQLAGRYIVNMYDFVLNRMLMSRFWGRLRSVSTPASPSWTVRSSQPNTLCLRETGTVPQMLTKHLRSVCVTMIHQCTTHLFSNLWASSN